MSQSSQTSAAPSPQPPPYRAKPAPRRGRARRAAPAAPEAGWTPPPPPLCLPPEVLEAPVGSPDRGWLFIERMDEWRRGMGWSNKDFAARLGITERYWYFLLRHEKELTIGVAERVIRERPEMEFILGSAVRYFQERRRRRKPRSRRGGAMPGVG
jgi:hypothetical protein